MTQYYIFAEDGIFGPMPCKHITETNVGYVSHHIGSGGYWSFSRYLADGSLKTYLRPGSVWQSDGWHAIAKRASLEETQQAMYRAIDINPSHKWMHTQELKDLIENPTWWK